LNPTTSFSPDGHVPHFSASELPSRSLSRSRVCGRGSTAISVVEVTLEKSFRSARRRRARARGGREAHSLAKGESARWEGGSLVGEGRAMG
jgi:hypothetical protein